MKSRLYAVLFFCIALSISLISCKVTEPKKSMEKNDSLMNKTNDRVSAAIPPVIIYKTKNDYYNNVPVGLSADKTSIISYPDIHDTYFNGDLAYPTKLANGYLLDNRGIGPNSAFTVYSYTEYSQLEQTPTPDILIRMILDNDPFTELYQVNCSRDTSEINKIIISGLKENCKKLK